jgi:hypothetical protein
MRLGSTISEGMLSASEEERRATGRFSEAAVGGLMSCLGDGSRLIEAVWMVSASSKAGSAIF